MITILGATGFIGSHIAKKIELLGIDHQTPLKNEYLRGRDLGKIIYCIGLTADFREHPLKTVDAHVCKVLDILQNCKFESFLYLSSTRLYDLDVGLSLEEGVFKVDPANSSHLYNISKLMGEALLHSCRHPIQIARLSNVYGGDFSSNNFLSNIIRQAVDKKNVTLETTLDSEKDYININDAVNILIKIALSGKQITYNVASGINTTNREIMSRISSLLGCQVEIQHNAKKIVFPKIEIKKIQSEFDFKPSNLLADMENLINLYKSTRRIKK